MQFPTARTHGGCRLWGLTFELTGSQRQGARPDERMISLTARRAWWPAVGAPVERGVRPHCEATADGRASMVMPKNAVTNLPGC